MTSKGYGTKRQENEKIEVTLEFVETITVEKDIVEEIASINKQRQESVAILLAYIEFIRQDCSTRTVRMKKISDEDLRVNLFFLFQAYSIEELIEIIRELKYYQIEEIFESTNPVKVIAKFL